MAAKTYQQKTMSEFFLTLISKCSINGKKDKIYNGFIAPEDQNVKWYF